MARRILLATIGSAGDVHPMLGVGVALRGRGHAVTLITNPAFEARARQLGLDFLPVGTAEDYERGLREADLWHPLRGFQVIARRAILPAMRPMHEAIAAHDPATTTVFASPLCFGARVAQERLGMPLVTHHLQPSLLWSRHQPPILPGPRLDWLPGGALDRLHRVVVDRYVDPFLAPEVNAFRAELGLPPARDLMFDWCNSPERVVGLFPAWFAPPQPDWPPQVRLAGFPLFDPVLDDNAPDPLAGLADGPPPLVATPGSAMVHGRDFFAAVVAASQRLGRPAILLTGHPEQLPARLPPGVIHHHYAPLRSLLPRAAAFIHHGGIGSTAQALAAGIPQVVMPMSHDQPDNAARLRRLGVGVGIGPDRFTGERLATALTDLLDSPVVAARCQVIARRCHPAVMMAETCRWIEEAGGGREERGTGIHRGGAEDHGEGM